MTGAWAVIAGGGTAGHVHPALAIAQELVARGRNQADIHFIGSERGLETTLVPSHGFALTALPGRGITRSLSVQNVRSALGLGVATARALRTLRRLRPAVLVSVGGYASLPALVAAVILRVPIVVTEQNSVPGAANRIAARWARVCAVAFENTDLPRAVTTGNPMFGDILTVDRNAGRDDACARLGIDPGRHVVAAFGGSLGARRINEAVARAAHALASRDDLAIRHIVGDRDWDQFGDQCIDGDLTYQTVRYEDAMADVYAAADLVVCRAGATSVAEIAETGTPAILVPLPGAPGDHQTRNARALADHGGARLIVDHELTSELVVTLLDELLDDPSALSAMGAAAKAQARSDAAAAIASLVEEHARER